MTELRAGTPFEAGMRPERIELARSRAAEWVKSGHTPSLVVLVARRGVIVLHEAFGKLVPEDNSPPLERDSIFPISSLTKPITATAVMALVEDGLLGLNRPVVEYLPELCGAGTEQILVHHLLTHTSGLDGMQLGEFMAKRYQETIEIPQCEATQHPVIHEYLTRSWPAPMQTPPGELMSYCTYNYVLLGEILRRVTGRSLADFARERIFDPLGMTDTHYIAPESILPRIVKRPAEAPFARPGSPAPYSLNSRGFAATPWPDGGVLATARDLATFGQMFLNGGRYGSARILSRAAVTEMTRNQIRGISGKFRFFVDATEASWGFGWAVKSEEKWKYGHGTLPPIGTYFHGGAGGAMLWVDPANEIVGVWLSVWMEMTDELEPISSLDLFQNVVTSAVED
ncbi:MAG: serine hydrolase domain-containing protein [Myxococcota bacterium]